MNINLLVFGAGIFDFIGGLSKYLNPLEWISLFLMGFRSILFFFDQAIYEFIITLYNIFRLLCSARIGSEGIAGELATRIGLILGLVMFFYVTFDFIQILIDPDKINDKEKGPLNIIKKFIIVIVLLGTSSFIFNYLHRFQTAVLSADDKGTSVLERLILPYNINTDNFGRAIASNFMMEFYKMTDDPEASSATAVDEDFTYEVCSKNAKEFPGRIAATGSLYSGTFCLNARYKTEDGSRFYIDFSPWSIVVGVFVIYMLFMYCISVGMRVAQLAVLEIISPVAFVSYLSPKKDGMFGKFWKIYFSTYIDVFLRIAIINFVVLLTGLILDSNNSGKDFWTSVGNPDGSTKAWISIFMILALLSFAKKFPDLIKKFLPESASGLSLGLQTPKQMFDGLLGSKFIASGAKRTYGAAAVGAATIQRNFRKNLGKTIDTFNDEGASDADKRKMLLRTTVGSLWSGLGGMRRGFMTTNKQGRKTAIDNAVDATQSKYKIRDAGYGSSIPGLLTKEGREGAKAYLSDIPRRVLMKDQRIEEMTEGSDQSISSLQQRLYELQRNYQGNVVQKSKTQDNMYIIYDDSGKERINQTTNTIYWSADDVRNDADTGQAGLDIAKLNSQIGKEQSRNKALHQKANEQKSKSGK